MSGLSLNYQQLQALEQLGSLLDLVKNPQKYADLIDRATAQAAELRQAADIARTVEAANRLLGQAQAKAEEAALQLVAAKDIVASANAEALALKAAVEEEVGRARVAASIVRDEAAAQQAEASRLMAELKPRLEHAAEVEAELERRTALLNEREARLQEKAEAVAKAAAALGAA